ncbi:MAG: GNAT family N-acetyltransferase [Anaerolineae bacterium]|nr:GNAT family N-acetyltransferase [Anaerolineae bacterium]
MADNDSPVGNQNPHGVSQDGDALLPPVELIPASEFKLEELTDAYNRSRVDYIVPMPMNIARLQEYIRNYDVNLELSVVALVEGDILALSMLGVRPDHTWITRLGVIPGRRRSGTGERMMRYLIEESRHLQVDYITLEVIQNNIPAYRLFRKLHFEEVRDLLIVRRPPGKPKEDINPYAVQLLGYQKAVELLHQRSSLASWLDETPSLVNAGNLSALRVELDDGSRGWLVYQNTVFQLGRLVLQTEVGDPYHVGRALIHALHSYHPMQDTKSENLPPEDLHWEAMQSMGYLESFRRIEMRLDLKNK